MVYLDFVMDIRRVPKISLLYGTVYTYLAVPCLPTLSLPVLFLTHPQPLPKTNRLYSHFPHLKLGAIDALAVERQYPKRRNLITSVEMIRYYSVTKVIRLRCNILKPINSSVFHTLTTQNVKF